MRKIIFLMALLLVFSACSNQNEDSSMIYESEEAVLSKEIMETEEETNTVESFVIKTAEITTGEHNASAKIEFLDDRTVILMDFYYDGKAPDVYIALGNFSDEGEFVKGEVVSPLIEGVYKGEEYRFSLSQNIDLELYQAISVWCDAYSEDFSSAEIVNE